MTIHLQLFGPLDHGHCSATISKQSTSACVATLLLISCPSTICRRVIAFIVFAIQRQTHFPRWYHIFVEKRKIMPPFADADSTPSIIWKRVIGGVIAPCIHAHPNTVNRMLGKPMPEVHLGRDLTCITTTRFGITLTQLLTSYFSLFAALALTEPNSFSLFTALNETCKSHNTPITKCSTA